MPRAMLVAHAANSVLRFGLELTALYGLARLGYSLGSSSWSRLALGGVLPGLMVLVWGAFIAPKARIHPPMLLGLALELVIFGGASWGIGVAHAESAGWLCLVVSTSSSWLNALAAPKPVATRVR